MGTKKAGLGATAAVVAAVFGLLSIILVILMLMWLQPGIEHSPSEPSRLRGNFDCAHPCWSQQS